MVWEERRSAPPALDYLELGNTTGLTDKCRAGR